MGCGDNVKRLACVILAACVACATPLAFVVSPVFTTPERSEIQRAADDWNAITTPESRITLSGGEWRFEQSALDSGWNGFASVGRRTVWIHPEHPGASVYEVALHEFGHALGLRHPCTAPRVQGPTSSPRLCDPAAPLGVMDPTHVSNGFSAEDLAECRYVGACK